MYSERHSTVSPLHQRSFTWMTRVASQRVGRIDSGLGTRWVTSIATFVRMRSTVISSSCVQGARIASACAAPGPTPTAESLSQTRCARAVRTSSLTRALSLGGVQKGASLMFQVTSGLASRAHANTTVIPIESAAHSASSPRSRCASLTRARRWRRNSRHSPPCAGTPGPTATPRGWSATGILVRRSCAAASAQTTSARSSAM